MRAIIKALRIHLNQVAKDGEPVTRIGQRFFSRSEAEKIVEHIDATEDAIQALADLEVAASLVPVRKETDARPDLDRFTAALENARTALKRCGRRP